MSEPMAERLGACRDAAVLFAVGASALLFWQRPLDDFALVKLTAVLLAAIVIVALSLIRWLSDGEVRVPVTGFAFATAAFAGAVVVTTLTSSHPTISFLGQYRWYSGAVPYLAYTVLGLAAFSASRAWFVPRLLRTVTIGGAVLAAYAVVQAAGLDPFEWSSTGLPERFSTMGNVNFASAYIGISAPLAVYGALDPAGTRTWRYGAAAIVIMHAAGLVVTGSFQGLLVAALGVAVVVAYLAWRRFPTFSVFVAEHQSWVWGLVALTFVAGTSLLVGLRDQVIALVGAGGYEQRLAMYEVALAIFRDQPLLGSGLDTYGTVFPRYDDGGFDARYPLEVAAEPHSVPLGMLSDGGLVLGLAYVAVIVVVGHSLYRSFRSTESASRDHLLLLGVMWLGYHVQSAVSMDFPSHAVLHWVTAGTIAGFHRDGRRRIVELPWNSAFRERSRKGGRRRTRRYVPTAAKPVIGLVVAASLFGAWRGIRPLRADVAAADAEAVFRALPDDQGAVAFSMEHIADATEWAPHNAAYWSLRSQIESAQGDEQAAAEYAARAAEAQPGRPSYARWAATLFEQAGNEGRAATWWLKAVEFDPNGVETLAAAAEFFSERDAERAGELQRRVRAVRQKVAAADRLSG